MSALLSENDSEYQTDDTSAGDDAEQEMASQQDHLNDRGLYGDESVCLPDFYRARASQVNNTEITNIYADSTILQFDSVES
jgi:hypothetical protein